MGEAKETYIPDMDGALHGLASMVARSDAMGERVAAIADRIRTLDGARPWGTAEEYGRNFERVYTAGDGGAEFVRQQAGKLAGHTVQGLTTAREALQAAQSLDEDGAALFKAQGGDAAQMGSITAALAQPRDSPQAH